MSDGTVLLTGATGLVGFRILEELLDQGSHVRLAVRSEAKFDALQKALAKSKRDTTGIEHVIVPDMLQEDAFADAIKGVTYVLHVASPMPYPSDDLETSIIKPAVAVTTGILHTLLQAPERSVKKIVITSSVAGVAPSEPKVFDADNEEPDPQGPWTDAFATYSASKKLALNATRRFIAEKKPYFDIVNIMPSFVLGPNHFATSRKDYMAGSNSMAMSPLLGREVPGGCPGFVCHVDDVAAVHVAALRPEVVGHRNFGVNYDGVNGVEWNDAIEIVKKKMPEAVGPDGFPLGGSCASAKVPFDASKTERELGITFKDFDTMVVDLAKAYLATEP